MIIFNFSGISKNTNAHEQNINTVNIAPSGSYYCTIINQSSNSITKIVVQQIYSPGNSVSTTYNSPSFPLTVPANGTVSIMIYFVHSGLPGGIRTYEQIMPDPNWYLLSCEDYDPRYVSPISYDASAGGEHQVVISNNICQ